MKIILLAASVIAWTAYCIFGISKNYDHYQFADWVIIILFMVVPYVIAGVLYKKITSKSVKEVPEHSLSDIPPAIKQNQETPQKSDASVITDAQIPYLIQAGLEEALRTEKESPNPKFHRTDHEEDLAFNFEMKYGHEIKNLTENFESLYREAYGTNDLDKKITLLKEAVAAFEKAKKFCFSKGKGGTVYFEDTWEHLHNSRNSCFSYFDNIQDALEDAEYLRDEAVPAIIKIIAENDGILQRNIYKLLPDTDKSTVQHTIKYLESEHKISKIKSGNSYELHLLT